MKLLIVNPNSSTTITNRIQKSVSSFIQGDLMIDVVMLQQGPIAIETYEDELLASMEIVHYLRNHHQGYDGIGIACFSDPGLMVLRECLDIPVVGIAQSTLHMANLYGQSIGFVTTGGREDIDIYFEIARRYGFEDRLKHVSYMNVGVGGVEDDMGEEIKKHIEICRETYGAEHVILGCGAFAGYSDYFDSYVMDGIAEMIGLLEMMVKYKKVGENLDK